MYRTIKIPKTTLRVSKEYIGETIEQKMRRILQNKEPIKDSAPIIYTERAEGVKPEFDIRTDRWDLATEKMDYVHRSHLAKRDERIAEQAKKGMEAEAKSETPTGQNNSGAESTAGTQK